MGEGEWDKIGVGEGGGTKWAKSWLWKGIMGNEPLKNKLLSTTNFSQVNKKNQS